MREINFGPSRPNGPNVVINILFFLGTIGALGYLTHQNQPKNTLLLSGTPRPLNLDGLNGRRTGEDYTLKPSSTPDELLDPTHWTCSNPINSSTAEGFNPREKEIRNAIEAIVDAGKGEVIPPPYLLKTKNTSVIIKDDVFTRLAIVYNGDKVCVEKRQPTPESSATPAALLRWQNTEVAVARRISSTKGVIFRRG